MTECLITVKLEFVKVNNVHKFSCRHRVVDIEVIYYTDYVNIVLKRADRPVPKITLQTLSHEKISKD